MVSLNLDHQSRPKYRVAKWTKLWRNVQKENTYKISKQIRSYFVARQCYRTYIAKVPWVKVCELNWKFSIMHHTILILSTLITP